MRLILIQGPLAAPEDVHSRLVWQQDDGLHAVILAYTVSQHITCNAESSILRVNINIVSSF